MKKCREIPFSLLPICCCGDHIWLRFCLRFSLLIRVGICWRWMMTTKWRRRCVHEGEDMPTKGKISKCTHELKSWTFLPHMFLMAVYFRFAGETAAKTSNISFNSLHLHQTSTRNLPPASPFPKATCKIRAAWKPGVETRGQTSSNIPQEASWYQQTSHLQLGLPHFSCRVRAYGEATTSLHSGMPHLILENNKSMRKTTMKRLGSGNTIFEYIW